LLKLFPSTKQRGKRNQTQHCSVDEIAPEPGRLDANGPITGKRIAIYGSAAAEYFILCDQSQIR
jgi:hypothetical protein